MFHTSQISFLLTKNLEKSLHDETLKVKPNNMDEYLCPKISVIIPLVSGTVDSHNIPKVAEKTNTVNSFLGAIIKERNSKDLRKYSEDKRFFLKLLTLSNQR